MIFSVSPSRSRRSTLSSSGRLAFAPLAWSPRGCIATAGSHTRSGQPPEHLADDQQQALQRIGPRDRGLNHITARLLLTATRGELDDRWFKTASNSERVALQSLLKQRVLITLPGQTEIIPAPAMIYGLDPDLREPPALGALSPVGRRPEDHPGRADHAASAASATEQLATPD